jgi:hypothetical protein
MSAATIPWINDGGTARNQRPARSTPAANWTTPAARTTADSNTMPPSRTISTTITVRPAAGPLTETGEP